MHTRTITIALLPDDNSKLFGHKGFDISIRDEGGGEFVEVEDGDDHITIDIHEWPFLRDAIERMVGECRHDPPN